MNYRRRLAHTAILALACLATAAAAGSAHAARSWTVLPDGTGDVPDIQSAAAASAPGDTILLGPGTFTGARNRDIEIWHDAVITSTHGAAATIVDCELQGAGFILGETNGVTHAYHVSGITVRNPRDTHSPSLGRCLYVFFATASIEACVFEGGDPGGIALDNCEPGSLVSGCRFADAKGGVVFLASTPDPAQPIRVADCTFERLDSAVRFGRSVTVVASNHITDCTTGITADIHSSADVRDNAITGSDVGLDLVDGTVVGRRNTFTRNNLALRLADGSQASFEDCTLENGGEDAVRIVPGSRLHLQGTTIADNAGRPVSGGGTVEMHDCDVLRNGKPIGGAQQLTLRIDHSTLADNAGAAIYTWASDVTIDHSTIQGNGGFSVVVDGSLTLTHSRILRNGGPIYIERESARIEDNLIAHNQGGVRFDLAGGTLARNTIVDNRADVLIESNDGGQSLTRNIIAFNQAATLIATRAGDLTVTACDLFGNSTDDAGTWIDGGNNIAADPWFCNSFDDDYSLQDDSPCLAANTPGGATIGAFGPGHCTTQFASLRMQPRAINTKAHSTVTAIVTGDRTADIDALTVRLNGVVRPLSVETGAGAHHDNHFRFSADAVAATFTGGARAQTFTLTAQLNNGTPLRATDNLHLAGRPDGPTLVSPEATAPGIHTVTPNPFNPVTRIHYGVTTPGPVHLVVYDVAGRVVATLVDHDMPAGTHQATWSATGTPSGVYFARLTTQQGTWTKKLVVLK